MDKSELSIKGIMESSNKAEILEWLQEHIKEADKCLVVCGYHNSDNQGLDIETIQMGFVYMYELLGFLEFVDNTWRHSEEGESE